MRKLENRKGPMTVAGIKVDFPQDKEVVTSPYYTFRIEARDASQVEISIDNSAWQDCRPAEGYWWHDWSGYMSGNHQAVARIQPQDDGQMETSRITSFRVELNPARR